MRNTYTQQLNLSFSLGPVEKGEEIVEEEIEDIEEAWDEVVGDTDFYEEVPNTGDYKRIKRRIDRSGGDT